MKQPGGQNGLARLVGWLLLPGIWIAVKLLAEPADRFLPSPGAVVGAVAEIDPPLWLHTAVTLTRLVIGFGVGVALGVALGLTIASNARVSLLLTPTIQSLRAVPATATVPFFLLWFGFSETGRLLLLGLGTALNVAIATVEAVDTVPERYAVFFRSVGRAPSDFTLRYLLPVAIERLLPTLRVTLAACFALEIVSELLGSQVGLGYLLQSARTTFAMHTIFLVAIVLGLMNVVLDASLRRAWQRLIYWR